MQPSRIDAQTGMRPAGPCGFGRGANIGRQLSFALCLFAGFGVLVARQAFSASAILSSYDLPGNLNSESNSSAVAPGFQQEGPSYVGITSNGLLAISAPATGGGPFTYQWYLNGSLIAGATTDSY